MSFACLINPLRFITLLIVSNDTSRSRSLRILLHESIEFKACARILRLLRGERTDGRPEGFLFHSWRIFEEMINNIVTTAEFFCYRTI